MGFNRFGVLLGIRLFFILLTLGLVGFLLITPGFQVVMLLALTVAVAMTVEVVRFISRTNQEVTRFLNAARYVDFGQRFEFDGLGAGFAELGATFTQILERFRDDRKQREEDFRHVKAMLEHVPVPLISLKADGHITLWNNSARRLFGQQPPTRIADLARYGADLPRQMMSATAGARMLVKFSIDGVEQSLAVSVSEITLASGIERLISLQNIQSELDATQIDAWRDLVRVLTHEIMNSITPVSSLAKTAVDLVDDVRVKIANQSELVAELDDVKAAVNTVARRSDGLMNFVTSYRQLTQLPAPEKSRFSISELFADVGRMAAVGWGEVGIELQVRVDPEELDLFADRQMIEQVLLNLLNNCAHALAGTDHARVKVEARLNPRGRVIFEVTDNGPGIPEEIAERIFVPFYTTRKEGSGVGLALSRQVMIAHGGSIVFANAPVGGARFSLTF